MLTVKGHYKDGKIILFEPLPEHITEADLNVIVLPTGTTERPISSLQKEAKREMLRETDFLNMGLSIYFDENKDVSVDWEDCFGLK